MLVKLKKFCFGGVNYSLYAIVKKQLSILRPLLNISQIKCYLFKKNNKSLNSVAGIHDQISIGRFVPNYFLLSICLVHTRDRMNHSQTIFILKPIEFLFTKLILESYHDVNMLEDKKKTFRIVYIEC